MRLDEHERSSVEKFGKPFTEVHLFLDQYCGRFGVSLHRLLLHHRLGVEKVRERYGDEAAEAAVQHIMDDRLIDETTGQIYETWEGVEDHSFYLGEQQEEDELEQELRLLFGSTTTLP